jgi:hypothetical protein
MATRDASDVLDGSAAGSSDVGRDLKDGSNGTGGAPGANNQPDDAGNVPSDASSADAHIDNEAGTIRTHICSAEGCNVQTDTPSAVGCPATAPLLGSNCSLADRSWCFYCDSGESYIPHDLETPAYICDSGSWVFEMLVMTCD